MLRSNTFNHASLPSIRQPKRTATVCVVDPNSADYAAWTALAEVADVRLIFATSAEQALRLVGNQPIDLWVINTSLPGLSGTELCALVRSQSARTAVYLVADEYSPTVERTAWQARPSLFGCKGAHAEWLSQWLELRRSSAAHVAATLSTTTVPR